MRISDWSSDVCRDQRVEQTGVCSVGEKDAELATRETRRPILDDAERGGGRQAVDYRPRRVRGLGQVEAQPVRDFFRKPLLDVPDMRQQPRADTRPLHLAPIEDRKTRVEG